MSRWRWIGAAVIAVSVGCSSAAPGAMPSSGPAVGAPQARCASIGPFGLTITRFINRGDRVTFEGRYAIPSSGVEATLTDGVVLGAHYRRDLDVVAVRDSGALPSWTLRDTTVPIPIRASTLTLTGEQLEGLKLRVAFTVLEAGRQSYELELHPTGVGGDGAQRTYDIAWRDLNDPAATSAQYCMKPGGPSPAAATAAAAGGTGLDAPPGPTMSRASPRYDARPRIASILGSLLGSFLGS